MIRFKGCKTEQTHAKEKAVTRRLRDVAENRYCNNILDNKY